MSRFKSFNSNILRKYYQIFYLGFVITVAFCFLSPQAHASKKTAPDSLLQQYKHAQNDTARLQSLKKIVRFWSRYSMDSLQYYSQKLINESLKAKQPHYAYTGYLWVINAFLVKGNNDSALFEGMKALQLYENDTSTKAALYRCVLEGAVGEISRASGHYEDALKYLHAGWDSARPAWKRQKMSIADRMAATYYEAKQDIEALSWVDSTILLAKELHDTSFMMRELITKAAILRDNGKYHEALRLFFKTLHDNRTNAPIDSLNILSNIAITYSYMKDYRNTIKYESLAFNKAKRRNEKATIILAADMLAKAYAAIGDYNKAYQYSRIYEEVKFKVFNQKHDNAITRLSTKYEVSKKDKQIARQQLILQKKELKIRERNMMFIIFMVFSILLLFFIAYLVFLHKKLTKNNKILKEQNNLIKKQKEEIETYLEQRNSAYKKLKSMSEYREALTNMLMHDLKNPLNLLVNIDLFEEGDEKREIINTTSLQMLNMVLNLVDISKAEEGKMVVQNKTHSLNDLVEKAIKEVTFLSRPKHIDLSFKVTKRYLIKTDEEILNRILINLLTNAIKFSPIGSPVEINLLEQNNGQLRLSIKDYGHGIAPEDQEVIFEKFKQIKKIKSGSVKSTGLGLAFCKLATKALGWEIGVESEYDKGASFWIEIPEFQYQQ